MWDHTNSRSWQTPSRSCALSVHYLYGFSLILCLLLFSTLRITTPSMDSPLKPSLIDDLIPNIIEHLAASSDASHVAPLARISSAWLNPVRKVLYSSPKLLTYHSCLALSQTLIQSPALGKRIHTLSLHPVAHPCSKGPSCECCTLQVFALSLAPLFRLDNLNQLILGGDCAVHAEWYLRSFLYPKNITSLKVVGMQWYWSFDSSRPVSASLRWSDSLTSRFSNLKHLEIRNLELYVCEVRSFKPKPPHLESLILEGVNVTGGQLSDVAPNAWNNLQELSLSFTDHSSAYDINSILSSASKSIQVLRVFLTGDTEGSQLARPLLNEDILASCTSLHSLQLALPFAVSFVSRLGDRLTQLKILKVFSNYEIGIEDWASLMYSGAFPSLRELHLPVGHELRRIADWQLPNLHSGTIRSVCANRGVDLHFAYLLSKS